MPLAGTAVTEITGSGSTGHPHHVVIAAASVSLLGLANLADAALLYMLQSSCVLHSEPAASAQLSEIKAVVVAIAQGEALLWLVSNVMKAA